MATANVTFLTAGGPSGSMQVYNASPLSTEDVASGATSAAAPRDCYVKIVLDADMRVEFGPAPTATATSELLTAGTSDRFVPLGFKVSVLDA